jgi:hypothetical protein
MKGYESIIKDGKTFIEIKAANDLRKELDNERTIVEVARSLRKTDLARIAELKEELSVWRSVFPSLAPRLFPEEEGKE